MQQDERRAHQGDGSSERGVTSSRRTSRVSQREVFIDRAYSFVGYRCRPGGLSDFGRRAGYSSHEFPWSGAFVDCVARDSGILMPSCVYSPSGLAEFIFDGRWRNSPLPGDIVFYSFSTKSSDRFSMPHVGVVVNIDAWKKAKCFVAVEGGVDGAVVALERWKYETIGFGRPDFKVRPGKAQNVQTGTVFVDPERVRADIRTVDVLNVQLALSRAVGLSGYQPMVFDTVTRRALARWQRIIGYVGADANGVPDAGSLGVLGERTGTFKVRPRN